MALYLIHQLRDGTPIGVFNENGDDFYFPQYQDREDYGRRVLDARGSQTEWDEWAEAQASKSPGPGGMWDTVTMPDVPLQDVLETVKRTMIVPQ